MVDKPNRAEMTDSGVQTTSEESSRLSAGGDTSKELSPELLAMLASWRKSVYDDFSQLFHRAAQQFGGRFSLEMEAIQEKISDLQDGFTDIQIANRRLQIFVYYLLQNNDINE
jgi:hypothetical protein